MKKKKIRGTDRVIVTRGFYKSRCGYVQTINTFGQIQILFDKKHWWQKYKASFVPVEYVKVVDDEKDI